MSHSWQMGCSSRPQLPNYFFCRTILDRRVGIDFIRLSIASGRLLPTQSPCQYSWYYFRPSKRSGIFKWGWLKPKYRYIWTVSYVLFLAMISRDQASKRLQELSALIHHHDFRYYVLDDPEISDAAYDGLFRELQELENLYPDLRPSNSPTLRVGGKALDENSKKLNTKFRCFRFLTHSLNLNFLSLMTEHTVFLRPLHRRLLNILSNLSLMGFHSILPTKMEI